MTRIMSHGSPLYAFSHTTHDTLDIFITIIALYNY